MDKAKLVEMLNALAPEELRVLRYEVKGGHSCDNSSSLIECCGKQRCEACHIPHMRAVHSEAKVYAFQKFYRAGTMTWPGYVAAATKKKPKVTKNRTKRAPATKLPIDPIAAANQVGDDDLDKVLAILEAKLRK